MVFNASFAVLPSGAGVVMLSASEYGPVPFPFTAAISKQYVVCGNRFLTKYDVLDTRMTVVSLRIL